MKPIHHPNHSTHHPRHHRAHHAHFPIGRFVTWLVNVLTVMTASTFIVGALASMALAFNEQTWSLRFSRALLGVAWGAIGVLILRYYYRDQH